MRPISTSRLTIARGTCAMIACIAAVAGCHKADRDAASSGTERGVETGTVATPIDSQQLRSAMDSTTSPRPSDSGGQGSDRANEIARAPRANPNAPPKPKITPGEPDSSSDTNPPKPDSTSKPKDTSGRIESKGTTESSGDLRDKYHPAARDTVSQVVYTGWKYFNLNCARCHGEDVTGTTIAPHLIDSFKSGKVDHDEFWKVVHGSRAERGMPNWSGLIDDEKLEAIYQYVKGRSEGKLHPGRPAQQGS
jgi:mono/diheme cytochrome c family protein